MAKEMIIKGWKNISQMIINCFLSTQLGENFQHLHATKIDIEWIMGQ
jgi:hypothetical protein